MRKPTDAELWAFLEHFGILPKYGYRDRWTLTITSVYPFENEQLRPVYDLVAQRSAGWASARGAMTAAMRVLDKQGIPVLP